MVYEQNPVCVKGNAMREMPQIQNAWLAIEEGRIADYGSMNDFPGISDWKDLNVLDADGAFVLPAWCDSHSHIVYAGSREKEFVDRINGLSYQEIAAKGGGILNSAQKLRNTSEEELFNSAVVRVKEVMQQGTGALEIKSGYGLSLESELKMLRVIKRLKEHFPIEIKATFLGAHAIPKEFSGDPQIYINLIIDEMIPAVAKEKLADFIDVFCEENYFSYEDSKQILNAGKAAGLTPKVHAEQLSNSGGVRAGVECGAISVDHLEYLGEEEIQLLAESNTIPVILPGAQFFLNLPHPPARRVIDSGLALAIASDFNPGSSPSGNMNLMQSLACVKYKMNPNECIHASTINGAYAMKLDRELGTITRGKLANLIVTKPMEDISFLHYSFGSQMIDKLIVKGKIQN